MAHVATVSAQIVDVLGSLSTTDFNTYIASQTFQDWGNEPSVAVNPLNPLQIVISSFGYSAWVPSLAAQLWCSTNGGASWAVQFAVPTPFANDDYFVDDQTYSFDNQGVLHCGLLALDNSDNDHVYHGSTTNVNSSAAWIWNATPFSASSPDQPWIAIGGSNVAVA